ncbi:hypothetical protein RY27_05955 [Litorilinea aerophila]|nr:hypothetical protein RY27_05955 [Litorilinea aerophila]
MGFIIQYVATYAPWIYAICGLTALYQIYRIWLVRSERRQAVFSLEREKAVRDMYNIFAIALLLLFVMGVTYFTSTTLATAVDPLVSEALQPTPAFPFVPTPTNTPLPVTPTPTFTPTAAPAVVEGDAAVNAVETPPASQVDPPTPTPVPTPAIQAPACPDSRSVLLRPGNNEVFSGVINVIGTATHENFQYYKIEFAPGANADANFGYLAGGTTPVTSNVLASIDTASLGNGTWTLRLIVVDQTGNYPPPCQVTINVQN